MVHLKKQLRIIGIDDTAHIKGQKQDVLVIGAIFRGAEYLDNLLSTFVKVDGTDATAKLVEMINNSRVRSSLRVIMLDGIALAGFNVIDIQELSRKTKLPVIVVTRNMPNFRSIKKALRHFKDGDKRWKVIERAGKPQVHKVKHKELAKTAKIYFQFAGLSAREVRQLLKLTIRHGAVPEPVRVAHIIGQGIALGESRGRA
ncbi:MAG: DUF99 family protein [Candidatus Nanoarchaeia archaeon]